MLLDEVLDMYWLARLLKAVNRTTFELPGIGSDLRFLDAARRAAVVLPVDTHPRPESPFPERVPAAGDVTAALHDRRVVVAASGGSGAMACLLGVLRAFEEASLTPAGMTVCSGSALFGFAWAAGKDTDEVAAHLLGLRPRDYVDIDWAGLLAAAPRLGRGFGGIVRGDALEATMQRWLDGMTLADLPVPCSAPTWNIEENRLEFLGLETTPDMTVARAIRIAVALPIWFAPVPRGDGWWCDGGLVDVLPTEPLLASQVRPDGAVVVNGFFPRGLVAETRYGWETETAGLLRIESQARNAQHLQLARANIDRLRRHCPVELVDPVPGIGAGPDLYRHYIDNRAWPGFMRAGLQPGREALKRLAARPPRGRRGRTTAPPRRSAGAAAASSEASTRRG